MYVKGSEGYLSQLAGDRLGRTAGVGACGICLGRLDRHAGCGHMIAAAFDSDACSAHFHQKTITPAKHPNSEPSVDNVCLRILYES